MEKKKNFGKYLHDLGVGKGFLNMLQKSTNHKGTNKCISLKLRMSAH